MKKILFSFALLFSFVSVFAQNNTETGLIYSDAELMKMDISDFCKAVGISTDYNKRYEAIILPLCDAGKMLFFDKESSLALDTMKIEGRPRNCYVYSGTGLQNEILKRNILANRQLIVKGRLSLERARKWKVIK